MLTECHRSPNTESQMWRQAQDVRGRHSARPITGRRDLRWLRGVNPECQPDRGQTQPT
jgi:hypothetical protein